MRVTWRTEAPQWILIAGMFLLALVSWARVPDQVPVHWSAAGQVDRYGSKGEGLLLLPALTVGVYVLLLLIPRIDPGRANYTRFAGVYSVIRIAVVTTLAGLYGVLYLLYSGRHVDIGTLAGLLTGGLCVILGELMPKIRPNWFVGIRTPWTLSSKLAWAKTHRLGGWLFIAAGLAMMAAGLAHTGWAARVVLDALVGIVVWSFIYSYLVWRTDPQKILPAGTSPAETE